MRELLQRAFNAAARRGWVRAGLVARRSYKGAEAGRLTASWSRTPTTADAEIRRSLRPLRARSREMARNSGYMRRFLGLMRSNVIGPQGIVLQAAVIKGAGKPSHSRNEAIEAAWGDWCLSHADMRGQQTWLEMLNLIMTTIIEDGEVLIRKHMTAANRYGCAIELIDPELLDVEHNDSKRGGGGYIRMGIEYNAKHQRVAYWLRDISKDGDHYSGEIFDGRNYMRVPAVEIIHKFMSERVAQSRGVPWAASVMWKAHQQDGYEEAAVTAARIGASKMGFFKFTGGGEYKGTAADGDGGALIEGFEPGGIESLPEGVDFDSFNPDYPHAQFGAFSKHMLQGISAGLGVSYNALANDLEGVNYSSIRAGVLEDREAYKSIQRWIIDSPIRPIYEFWLESSLIRGAIQVSGRALSIREFDRLRPATWQARRWAWVDPKKDMEANRLAYEMGATSLTAIIRDTGRDPEEVWRERQREAEAMAGYGVAFVGRSKETTDEGAEE